MKFAPYPEYSPTGIKWIDDGPSHWKSIPIKYVALEHQSLFLDGDWIESKDLANDGVRYLTTGNVGEGRFKEQGAGFISDDKFKELKCTEVYPGDVLISRLNRPIGRACIVPDLGFRIVTSVDNVIVRADGRYARSFLVYLFSSKDYFRHTDNLARGATMQRISRGLLGNIRIVVPAVEEQTQIAKFLDYETAKIDALIEKQQQLIALLKEKRQAVISHAVTKGLNPDTPMLDSGVEWLGEIPAHWEIRRAKYLLQEQSHKVRPGDEIVTSFRDGQVCLRSRRRSTGYTMAILEHGYQGIRRGDLVVHSMDAFAGAIGVSEDDGRATPEYVVVRPFDKKMDCEYYAKILRVMAQRDFIFVLCPSVRERAPRFRFARLQEVLLPVPPPAEQAAIVAYLSASHGNFTSLLELTEDQVAVLQERRAALISAAVTGKIDVRDWKAPESETEAEVA